MSVTSSTEKENDMLHHLDADSSRQLVRERHAELKQDWRSASPARPTVVESRRDRRFRFEWLRTHVRSAGHAAAGQAS